MEDKRSFTVEASSVNSTGGRYISNTPSQAARKAANLLFRENAGKNKLEVQMRETTQNSPDSLFAYKAVKTAVNKTVNLAGKKIQIKQEVKLTSIPLFHGNGASYKKK